MTRGGGATIISQYPTPLSPPMLAPESFASALPFDEFLARYGQGNDKARWGAARADVALTEDQLAVLKSFTRELKVVVLAGAWCGDCAAQCPIFEAFAAAAPTLKIRYLDRDDNPEVAAELAINGGKRVPVAVFFSEDGQEISRFGEKTLTAYRAAGQRVTGGTLPAPGTVAGDWLREFERAQWVGAAESALKEVARGLSVN